MENQEQKDYPQTYEPRTNYEAQQDMCLFKRRLIKSNS
jgi:hypothetical protein